MNASELLAEMESLGLYVFADGGDIVVRGPREISRSLGPRIRANKTELLAILRNRAVAAAESVVVVKIAESGLSTHGYLCRLCHKIARVNSDVICTYCRMP